MNEAKHTRAPWRISDENPKIIKQDLSLIGSNSGVLIAFACGHHNSGLYPSDEQAIANARLIAAAPELLEALNRIVDGSGSDEELGTLAARISHMRAVAAHGVAAVDCEEPLAYLDSAAIAISKSLARFRQLGKVGLSGQELAALRYGLEMADLLQNAATRRELADGIYATFGGKVDIIEALA